MEVDVLMRRYWRSIEFGWFEMPAPESGLDLLVDAMADRPNNFSIDDISLVIDGDLDDHITSQVVRKLGAVNGFERNYGISDVHVVTKDWSIDEAPKR